MDVAPWRYKGLFYEPFPVTNIRESDEEDKEIQIQIYQSSGKSTKRRRRIRKYK